MKELTRIHDDADKEIGPKVVREVDPGRRRLLAAALGSGLLCSPLAAMAGSKIGLHARHAIVTDLQTGQLLYARNAQHSAPIASITKLMTAITVLASRYQPLDEVLEITSDDVDRYKNSRSRLPVGTRLTRAQAMHLALMSSENRAAHALGRCYPGGETAFVRSMNDLARAMGMRSTRFVEPTGLSEKNVASAIDLVPLARVAHSQRLVRFYSTEDKREFRLNRGQPLMYRNSNRLVQAGNWDISLSKTGYIREAGRCLAMVAKVRGRDVVMVTLGAHSNDARLQDARTLRQWTSRQIEVAGLGSTGGSV